MCGNFILFVLFWWILEHQAGLCLIWKARGGRVTPPVFPDNWLYTPISRQAATRPQTCTVAAALHCTVNTTGFTAQFPQFGIDRRPPVPRNLILPPRRSRASENCQQVQNISNQVSAWTAGLQCRMFPPVSPPFQPPHPNQTCNCSHSCRRVHPV